MSDYLRWVSIWIYPFIDLVVRQDNRHPLVYELYVRRGLLCKDYEIRKVIHDPVKVGNPCLASPSRLQCILLSSPAEGKE